MSRRVLPPLPPPTAAGERAQLLFSPPGHLRPGPPAPRNRAERRSARVMVGSSPGSISGASSRTRRGSACRSSSTPARRPATARRPRDPGAPAGGGARVDIHPENLRYRRPLRVSARAVRVRPRARWTASPCSAASPPNKYVLRAAWMCSATRLTFPKGVRRPRGHEPWRACSSGPCGTTSSSITCPSSAPCVNGPRPAGGLERGALMPPPCCRPPAHPSARRPARPGGAALRRATITPRKRTALPRRRRRVTAARGESRARRQRRRDRRRGGRARQADEPREKVFWPDEGITKGRPPPLLRRDRPGPAAPTSATARWGHEALSERRPPATSSS